MPVLTSKSLFNGNEDMSPTDLANSVVQNFNTHIDTRLREHFKWKGKHVGAVGLSLSADNARVTNGIFITRGATGLKEQRIPCNLIWYDSSPDLHLVINFPQADIFRFDEGGMWSSIVPSSEIIHSYHDKNNAVIMADQRENCNITDFCARMVCQLSNTSDGRKGVIVKYVILLFPCAARELSETPESQFPGWPGVKTHEGTFPLVPKPSVAWKCPCVPFIRPGVPFSEVDFSIRSSRIRFAVGAVMNKAGQPDIHDSGGAVLLKWDQIRTNPLSIFRANQVTTWPDTALESEESGKRVFSFNYKKFLS